VEITPIIVGLSASQDDQGKTGNANIGQRLLETRAEATNVGEDHIGSALRQFLSEGVVQTFSAVASTTSAHADRDTGNRGDQFGQARLANSVKRTKIQDGRHQSLSRSMV
jgi:hypothetical protein